MEFSAQNPDHLLINIFSETFESSFLDLLRRHSHHVSASNVYQEMLRDRNHVHMNSTRWATLPEFVRYLGEEGRCKVEETPKGLFITYSGSNSENDGFEEKRLKAELADEERHERDIRTQIEGAQNIETNFYTSHSASEERGDVSLKGSGCPDNMSRVKHQFEELLHM